MNIKELKQLALLKLQKGMPKTKKELEAFVLGESAPATAPATALKKQTAKEVKEVQEHLAAKKCPKVKPEELEGMQSHKEAVSHLKKKKCPETEAVSKKSYVAPAPMSAPEAPVTKSGRPKKEYTEEQKAANREKMAKLRAMRGKAKKDSEPESDYVY